MYKEPKLRPRKSNVHYILNPGGDLMHTQKEFEALFSSQPGWEGVTGVAPTANVFLDGLSKKDIFIYFGHGSGESFLRSTKIRSLQQCATTILMGCSSGKQQLMGDFNSKGTPTNYMFGGWWALFK
ncbi:separase/separin [Phlyctochytrium planicorne]|nr:separase/separin [Phlyctochytrium planicorne]